MATLIVNGENVNADIEPNTPLLWFLRDHLNLTGTKFGCGIAVCGACTVHLDKQAVRSCVTPISACEGKQVTTIEGLSKSGHRHAVQEAWIEHQVPQCGYCQSGVIMATVALLVAKPAPTEFDIATTITNICRCGTYPRIRRAIAALANVAPGEKRG